MLNIKTDAILVGKFDVYVRDSMDGIHSGFLSLFHIVIDLFCSFKQLFDSLCSVGLEKGSSVDQDDTRSRLASGSWSRLQLVSFSKRMVVSLVHHSHFYLT